MLLIGQTSMYNADVSIQENNGTYNLIDTEDNVLFSSTKIAHVNKALQYVTEQDARGNGILIDKIASAVFGTIVVFNNDTFKENANEIKETLEERGIQAYFLTPEEYLNDIIIHTAEYENEEFYARRIEERISIGFSDETRQDSYQTLNYEELSDYFGMKEKLPEVSNEIVHSSQEQTTNNDKQKYIIETKNNTILTPSISVSEHPTRKGFYYINDDTGKGFFKSKDKDVIEAVAAHINTKAAKGEVISIKELYRIEYAYQQEKEKKAGVNKENISFDDTNIENQFEELQKVAKHIEDLEKEIAKEKENLQKQLESLKTAKAPEAFVKEAEKIYQVPEDSLNRVESIPNTEHTQKIKAEAKENAQENAYVTYRLGNSILTRASSMVKAGAMNAYLAFMNPIRKLGDLSMTEEVKNLTKDNLQIQHKLERYEYKLSEKMEKRIARENKMRTKHGKEQLPPDTKLYTAKERQRINEMTQIIVANNNRKDVLQMEIVRTRQAHSQRLEYVKNHTAIASNTIIIDQHKTVINQNKEVAQKDVQTQTTPSQNTVENTTQEEKKADTPLTPDYVDTTNYESAQPDDTNYEYIQPDTEIVPLPEAPLPVQPEATTFAPINERFSGANKEADAAKIEKDARFIYRALNTMLPANGYIEFEGNGNSYSAQKNEYDEFELKKYNYETGLNEKLSPNAAIEEFKKDTKAFEATVKEALGSASINKEPQVKQQTLD